MTVLRILDWVMNTNTVITATLLIMFAFGCLLKLVKGGNC